MSSLATDRHDNPRSIPIVHLPRLVWLASGAAALAGSIAAGGAVMLALWLAPDLAFLTGLPKPFLAGGRLNPRAVRGYNAAHYLFGPLALTLGGLVLPALLPLGLIWLSHVAIDRGLGYYPRDRAGNIRNG